MSTIVLLETLNGEANMNQYFRSFILQSTQFIRNLDFHLLDYPSFKPASLWKLCDVLLSSFAPLDWSDKYDKVLENIKLKPTMCSWVKYNFRPQ